MRMASLLAAACLALGAPAFAQEWSEGFETGTGGAQSYHAAPHESQIEIGTDDPAEGRQYLRAIPPDNRTLGGFALRAGGLTPRRPATVTAQVRGKGELWLCLISAGGWLYAPDTVVLSDRWQTISLSKVLVADATSIGINFLSRTAQTGAVFEVDDVQVRLEPPLTTYDAPVGPWRFEAEDYTQYPSHIMTEATALGGRAIRSGYLGLHGFPFPRTSRPVSIYLRVRPESVQESYRVRTEQGGPRQLLATIQPERAGEWHWVRFPPLTANEVGDSFLLDCRRDREAPGQVVLDAVVLATREDLSPEELEQAPSLPLSGPRAVVPRTDTPPVIDGRANDPCW